MPDNPSRREVWEAVVKDEEMRAASLSGRLAAMQARAEKAERALEITGDAKALARFRETERERDALLEASRLAPTGMETVRAAVRLAHDPDARILLKANIGAAKRAEAAEARIAALEARLAEQAPVVEAAERYCGLLDDNATGTAAALDRLEGAVTALRAARSLRGAGEAARPMASDMIDCPRCGRTHAAYIQGCAVEGGSDATGNGWDARGAGEGGGA